MLPCTAMLLAALAAAGPTAPPQGMIAGQVVNASRDNTPVPAAEVVLQVRIDGEFVPVEKTRADSGGRFRFESLPLGDDLVYLPGASRDGIHYPGRRIALTSARPAALLTIAVRETVAEPNPLVVRQHEIVVRGEPGALHVVEAMLIDNPTQATFVGQPGAGHQPVTFELSIPKDFERLTFEEEFYGREFTAVDQRIVTGIPWTPGKRWLRFTYSIANEEAYRVWERRIDVPCDRLSIRVQHHDPDEVTCNLAKAAGAEPDEAVFAARQPLPAGHVIQIGMGRMPLAWTRYARWLAVVALLGAVIAAGVLHRWNRPLRSKPAQPRSGRRSDAAHQGPRGNGRTARRRRIRS